MNTKANKKAAVYARVSTTKEEQDVSFALQKEEYTKWLLSNNLQMYGVYADRRSGLDVYKREGFLQMLSDAGISVDLTHAPQVTYKITHAPKFDMIVCKDLSRFSRNPNIIDLLGLLKRNGVTVYFQNQGINTSEDEANWSMLIGVLLQVNKQELMEKSRKHKFSRQAQVKNGTFKVPTLPYGYKRDEYGEITINEVEAEIVKEIFVDYANGMGIRFIANKLNEEGKQIIKPNGTLQQWYKSRINTLIKNTAYMGHLTCYKQESDYFGIETKVLSNPKDKQVIIQNYYPPIVTAELWEKVQQVSENKTQKYKGNIEKNNIVKKGLRLPVDDLFYGKVFCYKCKKKYYGKKYLSRTKKEGIKELRYYRCYARTQKEAGLLNAKCDNDNINMDTLLQKLERFKDGFNFNIELERKFKDEVIAHFNKEKQQVENKRKEVQQKIDDAIIKKDKLINLIIGEADTQLIDIYKREIKNVEDNLFKLAQQMEQHSVQVIDAEIEAVENTFRKIQYYGDKTDWTIADLIELVDRIYVKDKRTIDVWFNIPTFTQMFSGGQNAVAIRKFRNI